MVPVAQCATASLLLPEPTKRLNRGNTKRALGVSFCRFAETRYCMTDPEFRNAFYAHSDVLYRFVYRMTGSSDGAEDIVQECFLALWRKREAYDPHRGALRAFLLGIARNLVL